LRIIGNRFFSLIIIPIAIVLIIAAVIFAEEYQGLTYSRDISALSTDTIGGVTEDGAYVYVRMSVCGVELTMLDESDTIWVVDTMFPEHYAVLEDGIGFRSTGCVLTNIKLACESDDWRAGVIPPYPGFERYVLWATTVLHPHPAPRIVDFWRTDSNRTINVMDTVPNYDYITTERFYFNGIDPPPTLSPPMDDTGMYLRYEGEFYIFLMIQAPTTVGVTSDSTALIKVHVVAEPNEG